jgi:nitroreductase/Pyruvate/2-oxoacid:ferredoxin oxidoreductase delta subunit
MEGVTGVSQITVDAQLCRRDGLCVAVCPSGAIRRAATGSPEETPGGNCVFCGHCVAVCPHGALTHHGLPDEPMLPMPAELPSPAALEGLRISRRSVREFKNQPLGREVLEALLEVARRAPTATNSQRLHWIVVNDPAKVRGLSAETIEWLRAGGFWRSLVERWEGGYDPIMRGAPAAVVALTPSDYEGGVLDCAIALSYVELAAAARGIGVCWAGFLTRAAAGHAPLRGLLAVPEGYAVRGALMLGEPLYKYRRVPPRKPLRAQWL